LSVVELFDGSRRDIQQTMSILNEYVRRPVTMSDARVSIERGRVPTTADLLNHVLDALQFDDIGARLRRRMNFDI
jgi:hypothetical protein